MAHLMWLEADEAYRSVFASFAALAESRGHVVSPILLVNGDDPADWIEPADAFIVRTTAYIDEEPLRDAFARALDAEKRVLVLLRDARANAWLEQRFGVAVLDDRHFDLTRYENAGWANERGLDHQIARPASAAAKLDTLLAGVERLTVEQPCVVRCFGPARPLLDVKLKHLVTREDFVQGDENIVPQDRCIAAASAAPGSGTAQVVVIGDGACLIDEHLSPSGSDNRRFAENLVEWLSGARSRLEVAREARDLIDEIDLTLTELVVAALREKHGTDDWWRGLPEQRLAKIREQRPDTAIDQALNLSDKVTVLFRDETLRENVGLLDGNSRKDSERLWKKLVPLRNRLAHPDRLVEPVSDADLGLARDLAEVTRAARARWLESLDDDPRQLAAP